MRYRYIYEIGDTHFYAIVQIQEWGLYWHFQVQELPEKANLFNT